MPAGLNIFWRPWRKKILFEATSVIQTYIREMSISRRFRNRLTAAAVMFLALCACLSASSLSGVRALQGTNGSWSFSTTGATTSIDAFTWYTQSTRATTLPSGLTVSVAGTSGMVIAGAGNDQALSVRGGANGNFVSDGLVSAVGVQLATTDDGCTYGNLCASRGTLTVSFSQPVTNPVLSISGIGGGGANGNVSGSKTVTWTELELTTPNITMTKLSGVNMQIVGQRIEPVVKNPSSSCSTASNATYGATSNAMCGSIRMNGTMSSFTFTADLGTICNATCYAGPSANEDGWTLVVSVDEDFGLAPSSYDTSPTSHVVGDLKMGSSVTADQTSTANPTTNVDAVASGSPISNVDDGTTAFASPISLTPNGSFSATVALTGVTANATLCGWIDFNANGVFDNPSERACASPTANASSATLTWAVPAQVSPSAMYARLRFSFDSAANSPVGKLASGEIEDYSFSQSVTTTTTPSPSTTVVAASTTVPSTTAAPVAVSATSTSTTVATSSSSSTSTTVGGVANSATGTTPYTGSHLGSLVWFGIAAIGLGFQLIRAQKRPKFAKN